MDPRAIAKAQSRLRNAEQAVADLAKATTFTAFSDQWYIFLVNAKNIYTLFEQGAKVSPQSRQWFGGKRRERIEDELLQYLYQARNDEEHGLGTSLNSQPEMHEFGVVTPNSSGRVVDENGNVLSGFRRAAVGYSGVRPAAPARLRALDGKPVLNKYTPESVHLLPVTARGPTVYQPPTTHLGAPVPDTSPLGVANLGLTYLKKLVDEAAQRAE